MSVYQGFVASIPVRQVSSHSEDCRFFCWIVLSIFDSSSKRFCIRVNIRMPEYTYDFIKNAAKCQDME